MRGLCPQEFLLGFESWLMFQVLCQVVLADVPQRMSMPQRLASLLRFREKRKERNFDKKIRYNVRKEVALRYFFSCISVETIIRMTLEI